MAAGAKRNQGKTAFVREVLLKNPLANAKTVREEWTAAGRSGTISQTLVNKLRSELGLAGNLKGGRPRRTETVGVSSTAAYTGKKRGRKPKSASPNGHAAAANGTSYHPLRPHKNRQAELAQIEADIDRLLFRVMSLGGLDEIEDSLRRTRRLVYGVLESVF